MADDVFAYMYTHTLTCSTLDERMNTLGSVVVFKGGGKINQNSLPDA